jgi:hypothetical protein
MKDCDVLSRTRIRRINEVHLKCANQVESGVGGFMNEKITRVQHPDPFSDMRSQQLVVLIKSVLMARLLIYLK